MTFKRRDSVILAVMVKTLFWSRCSAMLVPKLVNMSRLHVFVCFVCVCLCWSARAQTYAYVAFVGDVHNRIEEQNYDTWQLCTGTAGAAGNCVGGWARITAQAQLWRERAKKEYAGFFFLDSGDEFNGTDWDRVYNGSVTAQFQNLAGVSAMQLGNHEFDYGLPALRAHLLNAKFPVLGACNIDASAEPLLAGLLKRWTILEFTNGNTKYKLGVVGWITDSTKTYLDSRGKNYGKVMFLPDNAATIQACVDELRRANPDVAYVIGLAHAGINGSSTRGDIAISQSVKGLNLIIGGHSHTFLYKTGIVKAPLPIVPLAPGTNTSNCQSIAKSCEVPQGSCPFPMASAAVPIVHSWFSSKYMGIVRIQLRDNRLSSEACAGCGWGPAQPVLLGGAASSNPVTPDPQVLRLINTLKGPVRTFQRRTRKAVRQEAAAVAAAATADGAAAAVGFVEDDDTFAAPDQGTP